MDQRPGRDERATTAQPAAGSSSVRQATNIDRRCRVAFTEFSPTVGNLGSRSLNVPNAEIVRRKTGISNEESLLRVTEMRTNAPVSCKVNLFGRDRPRQTGFAQIPREMVAICCPSASNSSWGQFFAGQATGVLPDNAPADTGLAISGMSIATSLRYVHGFVLMDNDQFLFVTIHDPTWLLYVRGSARCCLLPILTALVCAESGPHADAAVVHRSGH